MLKFLLCLFALCFHVVSAMKAKATRKKGRGVSDAADEGPTGGALRCELILILCTFKLSGPDPQLFV